MFKECYIVCLDNAILYIINYFQYTNIVVIFVTVSLYSVEWKIRSVTVDRKVRSESPNWVSMSVFFQSAELSLG